MKFLNRVHVNQNILYTYMYMAFHRKLRPQLVKVVQINYSQSVLLRLYRILTQALHTLHTLPLLGKESSRYEMPRGFLANRWFNLWRKMATHLKQPFLKPSLIGVELQMSEVYLSYNVVATTTKCSISFWMTPCLGTGRIMISVLSK